MLVSTPSPPKSQKSAFTIFFVQSSKIWLFSSNTFLSQNWSKAPHLIRLSSDFLLITWSHLLRKSSKLWKGQFFCLSCWIVSPISSPIPFALKNQSLIVFPSAATWLNDSLASGGRTLIGCRCLPLLNGSRLLKILQGNGLWDRQSDKQP